MSRRTVKATPLSNIEWVARATSKDPARPVLTGIYATKTHLVATDGRRLHLAPNAYGIAVIANTPEEYALPLGLWRVLKSGDREPIDGTFPDYAGLKSGYPAQFNLRLDSTSLLVTLCRGAEAINKSLPAASNIQLPSFESAEEFKSRVDAGLPPTLTAFNPTYLREMLEGFDLWAGPIDIAVRGLGPMVLCQPNSFRAAVQMPIRISDATERAFLFDASRLVIPTEPKAMIDPVAMKARKKRTGTGAGTPRKAKAA